MSHKAYSWFVQIPVKDLTAKEFRVLFHLCDIHIPGRPETESCFVDQENLRELTGFSNGGLNNTLNALEKKGFICRHGGTETGTRIRRTFFILGCDMTEEGSR